MAVEYRRFDETFAVRLAPGDEICASLLTLAEQENIRFAEISGLGAVNTVKTGVYDTAEKKYYANEFSGAFEITSLVGTLTRQDGKPYLHLHISVGDRSGAVYGGHLNRAVISATGEIIIRCINGEVGRRFDEEIGLNLFDFH